MKVLVSVLTLWSAAVVLGQSNQCPTSETHCLCQPGHIDCMGHSLKMIPKFDVASQGNFRQLQLSRNDITVIPDNAFAVLNVTAILLDNNNIARIEGLAFSGVSTHLKYLNLANNRLTSLPLALQSLQLTNLDVSWNPIPGYHQTSPRHGTDGLTDTVLRYLGSSLNKFAFGDSTLTSWPRSLTHLNQLQELRVSGANISYLPSNAFHGFEQTLTKLTIEYAALAAVPLAISVFTKLEELHLNHLNVPTRDGQTIMFGDMSMTAAPFEPIADTLKVLSLEYDGLTVFPEVISRLRVLENVSLSGNNLEFISDEAIRLLSNSRVTILSLRNCNLTRIPGSISDLNKLQMLDFSKNRIKSIESTDLQNLYSLESLKLSENPLRYVSDDSLCGLNNLTSLSLFNTSLTELSKSLKNLVKIQVIDLRESEIDCTCNLVWFKKWMDKLPTCSGDPENIRHIELLGNCETINQGITSYIDERLPTCPEYFVTQTINCTGSCVTRR